MTFIDWAIVTVSLAAVGAIIGLLAWCLCFTIYWIIAFINLLIDLFCVKNEPESPL